MILAKSIFLALYYQLISKNCQALVPSPVPLDPIPILNPKKSQIKKKQLGVEVTLELEEYGLQGDRKLAVNGNVSG